jgi:hypothetical protein
VGVLAWVLTAAFAQQPIAPKPTASPSAKSAPAPPKKQQAQQQPQQQQQQAQQQPAMPVTTEQALYLIRSTLLTLNDANRSGNYTVLRDLAAPDFQARNTAADLSQIFSDLRRRNFDLTAPPYWRRNSPPCQRVTSAAFCILPVIFRRGRNRSISICCFRTSPTSGGCSASPSTRRMRQ